MPKSLYDSKHAARRKAAEPIVNAGGAVCGFCRRVIIPGKIRLRPTQRNPLGRLVSNWDWDHTTGGPTHAYCNRRHGGIQGNKSQKRRRTASPVVRTWGSW